MEILVLLLLLRFGVCSKLLQDLVAMAALVPPLPSLLSLPVAVPLPGWMSAAEQFHPPRAGLERPRAEGRGGAGLGRDVYSLCRRPHAPRPLRSHWPLALQLLLTRTGNCRRVARSSPGREAGGRASPGLGWYKPLPPGDRVHTLVTRADRSSVGNREAPLMLCI